MLRICLVLCGWCLSLCCFANSAFSQSLLDNRFRVDPTIEQITFVIHRIKHSQPVVLVRPDGKKYYSWQKLENVNWYPSESVDIITVQHPMPGPWQAIGKVTPDNKIDLLSDLQLTADTLPKRLFQHEQIKFTARLTSKGQPVLLRDFLDHITLKVAFSKIVGDGTSVDVDTEEIVGEFADDGQGLDEKPGDGVFTVALPVMPQPGKYRVRVSANNGIFLRALEQEVLVYPEPIQTSFIEAPDLKQPHQIVVSGEKGMIAPGSIAVHVKHAGMAGSTFEMEQVAQPEQMKVTLNIPQEGKIGSFHWDGIVYATDVAAQRALVFPLGQRSYSLVNELDRAEIQKIRQQEEAEQKAREEQAKRLQERQEAHKQNMWLIGICNLLVIVLGVVIWRTIRQIRAKRSAS